MEILHTIVELREALDAARIRNLGTARATALVPTMGNLHDGHLSLVKLARERGNPVVASIFVNPLQFAPHEDFAAYPRTFERDCELLTQAGCDIVFAPSEREVYPEEQVFRVLPPPGLAGILEGAVRPGFFTGVATVVTKLFNMVQPAIAVFGKKDYQQLLVIEHLVRQLALPIEIVRGETVRASGGLALSSRNGYLSEAQLLQAGELHAVLAQIAGQARGGCTDRVALEHEGTQALIRGGWQIDYVAIRRRDNLTEPTAGSAACDEPWVALAAARLGETRLIDNLEI